MANEQAGDYFAHRERREQRLKTIEELYEVRRHDMATWLVIRSGQVIGEYDSGALACGARDNAVEAEAKPLGLYRDIDGNEDLIGSAAR